MKERDAAHRLGGEIDRLIAGQELQVEDDPLLAVAHRLHRLGDQLPPVPADLERRVGAMVRCPRIDDTGRPWRQAVWGALAATVVFLVVWFVAPSGQEVWAAMRQTLLGQTRVEVTPTIGDEPRTLRESLRDLVAAELVMGRAPALPRDLPEGYILQDIAAVSYPDLPPWISQPFFIELCYGIEDMLPGLCLRQYRLLFRQVGSISGVQIAGDAITDFHEVDLDGVTGTLLATTGDEGTSPEVLRIYWERDGRLLELVSGVLSEDELLMVAQSVR